MGNLIYLIQPISNFIPYVPKPIGKIKVNDKLILTGMVLFIYLIYSQIPLYGIYKTQEADPLHYMRVILASSRGTLAELGISPVIGSSYLMGILRALRVIKFDAGIQEERILYEQTVKFVAIVLTFGQAITFVIKGVYGPVNLIGVFHSILLIVQLVVGGIIIIILDEILSVGYGLISGISLFVATNISENLMMKLFSPFTLASERGIEYEGSIIAFFHFLITKKRKSEAIKLAFFRKSAPNLFQLFITLIIILLVIYLWKFKIRIKLIRKTSPGEVQELRIKLFYSSTTPVIIMNSIISHVYLVSQNLYMKNKESFLIKLLGTWTVKDGENVAISGLSYFLTPPKNFYGFISNPFKNIIYVLITLYISGWFTQLMVEVNGKGAIDMARGLKHQGFILEGIRDSEETLYQKLQKIIPTVSFLSGMLIAALKIFADLSGAIGSGTGLLLLVSNCLGVQEETEENIQKNNCNVFLEG